MFGYRESLHFSDMVVIFLSSAAMFLFFKSSLALFSGIPDIRRWNRVVHVKGIRILLAQTRRSENKAYIYLTARMLITGTEIQLTLSMLTIVIT